MAQPSMATPTSQIVTLTEHEPRTFAEDAIPARAVELLWRTYRSQVEVEPPSFRTNGAYRLTAQGWVGFIPVTRHFALLLQPKVPLRSLFGMLATVHSFHSLRFLDGVFAVESLPEFYEQIVLLLAQRVLRRCRQGIYRAYVARSEALPYLRGQLAVTHSLQRPWATDLLCSYGEQSADVAENQVLTWSLHCALQSGLCTPHALPVVRRAYRTLRKMTTLTPFPPEACLWFGYSRLNQDYRPLHALSRFILSHNTPGHTIGDAPTLPFVVDMARLFEQFVAIWLQRNIGPAYRVEIQERHVVDSQNALHFVIDIVVYDVQSGTVRWVLDTKYKSPVSSPTVSPEMRDVAQVLAYAQAKQAKEAILVYPVEIPRPLETRSGGIRLRTLTFSLAGDLEEAGRAFLGKLLENGSGG